MREKLKRRLSLEGEEKDGLLVDLLEHAEETALLYMGRQRIPPGLENTLVEMAATLYNRLGMEGETAHSEGGVTVTAESWPRPVALALERYRLAKVGG